MIINIIIKHWLELWGGRILANCHSQIPQDADFLLQNVTVDIRCLSLSVAGSNQKMSIFSVDQITRLLKFPGVARTFIVKIAVSLPSGETDSN